MSASVESSVAPLEAAAARVEADGRVLAEALTLRLRGPRIVLVGDASAVLGPLLRRAHVARGLFRVFNQDILLATVPIALVPRDPPLPPDLTPLAFVTWSVQLGQGLARRKAAEAAAEACERVGLGAEARVRLARSSLLTRRLTLLAHAAALSPRLAVIEEPLEGLGPDDVGTLLRAIDKAVGSACVLVSTPRADAASPGHALARGANEVVLLEGGRVLGQGRPDEVFTAFAAARPAPSLTPAPGFGPMPNLGPVSTLAPASSFGPVSSLAPVMSLGPPSSLAPVSERAPVTSLAPGAHAAPVTSLAPGTDAAPVTSLAPGTDAAPVTSLAPDADAAPVTSLAPGAHAAPVTSLAPAANAASLAPDGDVAPPTSLAPASDGAPVTSLAPAISGGAPPSQRMTRLAPEPTKAPSAFELPPASQRTTRLPDAEVLRLSALASAALHPNADPAPLTRRAPGVEPAFARAILADLEAPAAANAPSVAPTAPVESVLPPASEAEVSPPPPSPSAPARTSEAPRPSDGGPDPEKHDALGRPALARRSR
ncbi:MAG: hypothetical protein MUF34_16210 [Polyangiaceae bacterium]|nr:hypothetical protein [Polyangiaceae bacterium]